MTAVKSRQIRSGAGGAFLSALVSDFRFRRVIPAIPRSFMIRATRSLVDHLAAGPQFPGDADRAVCTAGGGVDLGDLLREFVLGQRPSFARLGAGEVVVVGGAIDLQDPAYPLDAVGAPVLVNESEADQEP